MVILLYKHALVVVLEQDGRVKYGGAVAYVRYVFFYFDLVSQLCRVLQQQLEGRSIAVISLLFLITLQAVSS